MKTENGPRNDQSLAIVKGVLLKIERQRKSGRSVVSPNKCFGKFSTESVVAFEF